MITTTISNSSSSSLEAMNRRIDKTVEWSHRLLKYRFKLRCCGSRCIMVVFSLCFHRFHYSMSSYRRSPIVTSGTRVGL